MRIQSTKSSSRNTQALPGRAPGITPSRARRRTVSAFIRRICAASLRLKVFIYMLFS